MDSSSSAKRELLFGLLALQNDFISREELIAATGVWLRDKSQRLDLILLDHGVLTSDDHQLLEALVDRYLQHHGGDPEASLAALSSVSEKVCRELIDLGDSDIAATMTVVQPKRRPERLEEEGVSLSASRTGQTHRFQIIRPHAKGGLGEVYVARDEELNREVALKEIQGRHADDPESRARFLLEAEITGGLEHPGIVPVYGLGQYADGRPFYAMRFIRGNSLREAVARFHAESPVTSRFVSLEFRKLLGRFVDVCNALEYAHARGVLHRDLKPGNIMLGKYGETLLVDWGLAKPAGQVERDESRDETLLRPRSGSGAAMTQMGSAIGTPAYMSPEQAEGKLDDLGPASDVYSLGATLHYLLTGKPPVEANSVGEVLQRVRQGQITAPRDLDPGVPKALDAVCGKAMALRPGDRYSSPQELSNEIERYLADEPVQAFREPPIVRLRRWARKHPAVVASSVAAAVVLLLALGIIASLQARHRQVLAVKNAELARSNRKLIQSNAAEKKARREAERQAKIAQAVNDFLQNDMIRQTDVFAQAEKTKKIDRNLTLREALDRAAKRIGDRFQDEPLVEAAIRLAIGEAYVGVGEPKKAIPHLVQAVRLHSEELGRDHLATLITMNTLARAYESAGQIEEAAAWLKETRSRVGSKHGHTRRGEANHTGDIHTVKTPSTRISRLEEAVKQRQSQVRQPDAATLTLMNELANEYFKAGRYVEAIQLFEKDVAMTESIRGSEHPSLAVAMNGLGASYLETRQFDKAIECLEQAFEKARTTLGDQHPETLKITANLGRAYQDSGQIAKALPLMKKTYEQMKTHHGVDHPDTLALAHHLATAYLDDGQLDKALSLLQQTFERSTAKLGLAHNATLGCANSLAGAYLASRQPQKAVELLEEVVQRARVSLGADHPNTIVVMNNLVSSYRAARRLDRAVLLQEEVFRLLRAKLGPTHRETLFNMRDLANLYRATDQASRAAELFIEYSRLVRKKLPSDSPQLGALLATTGASLIKCKSYDSAEVVLRECYQLRKELDPEAWTTYNAQAMLGAALVGQAETVLKADEPDRERAQPLLTEAEKLLVAAYQGLIKVETTIPKEGRGSIAEAKKRLVWLYTVWGKPDQAAKWLREAADKPSSKP